MKTLIKNKIDLLLKAIFLLLIFSTGPLMAQESTINLAGEWQFRIDSLDIGEENEWYSKKFRENIQLPGSMTTNNKGNDITLETPWTGSIFDSSYYKNDNYAKYRQSGNIKIPFWLQPDKYYKGAAWYQKTVVIPKFWDGRELKLFIERAHWETKVWIDNTEIGMQNSLGAPHDYNLSMLKPGLHTITVRVDNSIKDINVGINSHSISDHTQTNWNGMIGDLLIKALPNVYMDNIKVYPNVDKKEVIIKVLLKNQSGKDKDVTIEALVTTVNPKAEKLKLLSKEIQIQVDNSEIELIYPMGDDPLLWDEFNPNLYSIKVSLTDNSIVDQKEIQFGMRDFAANGTQFSVNGALTFLRGTLESGIFPRTGYPPTEVEEWSRILEICKSYGLNHLRFHSWCPPEAAFEAADKIGFYLQVESSSWANQGATIGNGEPIDQFIYDETERIINAYGNHPSFCMMAYGNEPAGENHKKYLAKFLNYWKEKEPRIQFTSAAGWPVLSENDFHNIPAPRIQQWGQELESIINNEPPRTNYDWEEIINQYSRPVISHEIGQWTVYPNFKEIEKYDGVLKAKNFEIFRDRLHENGMGNLEDSLLLASGKLQVLCYKADIEAALRTPDFGGFQLLDLHDFPGQGTALVGVLDPFWEEKGYVTAKEYSRFCNTTVPLARFPKMIYLNSEILEVPVEVAHFGAQTLKNITPTWSIKYQDGRIAAEGELPKTDIPLGNAFKLGNIQQSLELFDNPQQLSFELSVGDYQNSWNIWVYPAELPKLNNAQDIRITQAFDRETENFLQQGGTVLLSLPEGSLKPEKGGDIGIGFSSIFWNTSWTSGQAPHTLGVLCDPEHPALQEFPTNFHSDWQWWDAASHSSAIRLDAISPELEPIVRVIDDWFTARPLGLLFECKVGKGKLLVSGIDLISNQQERAEAKQLLFSLKKYMASEDFNPKLEISPQKIRDLKIN